MVQQPERHLSACTGIPCTFQHSNIIPSCRSIAGATHVCQEPPCLDLRLLNLSMCTLCSNCERGTQAWACACQMLALEHQHALDVPRADLRQNG